MFKIIAVITVLGMLAISQLGERFQLAGQMEMGKKVVVTLEAK